MYLLALAMRIEQPSLDCKVESSDEKLFSFITRN